MPVSYVDLLLSYDLGASSGDELNYTKLCAYLDILFGQTTDGIVTEISG